MMWLLTFALFSSPVFATDDCENECGHDEWVRIIESEYLGTIEACIACPWNSIGNYTTCICNPGYYEVNDINVFHEIDNPGYNDWLNVWEGNAGNSPNQVIDPPMYCARCPNGAHCAEEGTTIASVTSNEGYFAGTDGTNKEFFPCLNEACLDDSTCAPGYTGLTCSECEGELRAIADFECHDCNPSGFALISWIIDVSLFALVFVFYYTKINSSDNENKQRTQAEFVYLKILISFMQVNALLLRFDFDLGTIVGYAARVFKESSSSGFAWIEYGCVFKSSPAPVFVIKSLMAFALPAILSTVWIGVLFILDKINGSKDVDAMAGLEMTGPQIDASPEANPEEGKEGEEGGDAKKDDLAEAASGVATETEVYYASFLDKVLAVGSLFFFYLYPFLAEQSGRVFTCVRTGHGPDDLFMSDDLSIQCWSSGHWALVFMIWVPMTTLYTVGVPFAVTFMIRMNKNNITYLAANNDIIIGGDEASSKQVTDAYAELVEELKTQHGENWKDGLKEIEQSANQFLIRFGWYFFGYKLDFTTWEDMVFLRKLAIILIACNFNSDPFLQSMTAIAVMIVAVAAHERFKPICISLLDDFELGSLIATLGLYFAGALTMGNHVTAELAQVACFVFGGMYGLFTVYIFLRFVQIEMNADINLDDIMGTHAADDIEGEAPEGADGCSVM